MTPPAHASPALPGRDLSSWITAARPPRAEVDPFKPYGFFLEQERHDAGRIVNSGVILLTNKECPWRCVMCDLWKHTTTESVPSGAIGRQIEFALRQFNSRPEQLKLYNSGSFFDPAAIPVSDYADITRTISFATHVIVESHPRLIGEKAVRLRDLLAGSLEVAMGLETTHPQVLPRLNKKFDLGHFARAAEFLRSHQISLRAFVLVKPPFMDEAEELEWAVKSAEFAFACGATAVSLIPTRGGNGAMERLAEAGGFAPPRLATLERALDASLELQRGRVFADLWDLEQFSRCADCLAARRDRLRAVNLSQNALPAIDCPACGGL
ncbi:MAG TPA: radical SAM protein [Verrucomicrobiae bacterium]|nr:radical SAM protein [Verrucomicrobiae bacterium]